MKSAELLKLERVRISSNPLLPSSRHLRYLLQSPPILPASARAHVCVVVDVRV